jgi:hypothetical protein
MYWFSFGSKKIIRKKIQQHGDAQLHKSNVVVQALADWMVARGSAKVSK